VTTGLEHDRQTLALLARWSGELIVVERRALHLAQSLQRRIDRALELHAADTQGSCLEDGAPWPCPTVVRLGIDQTDGDDT
jgi:hypothetical protein